MKISNNLIKYCFFVKAFLRLLLMTVCAMFWSYAYHTCPAAAEGNENSQIQSNASENSVNDHSVKDFFYLLHNKSEEIYDGNGHWGENKFGYKMLLRDSYWRLDVYGVLSEGNWPDSNIFRQRAKEIVQYLLQAQLEGGTGVFGIPADPHNPQQGKSIQKEIQRYPKCVRNGWIVQPEETFIPNLYYDHGYALVSLVRVYKRTHQASILEAIRRGADWILGKPYTLNVNYLSEVSKGLCYAYGVTGDKHYLAEALKMYKEVILPHQTNSGQWDDPHNGKLVYHGFIVSGLIALIKNLPPDHPDFTEINNSLTKALELMKQEDLNREFGPKEDATQTNAIAWLELSEYRRLTKRENQALDRLISFMLNDKEAINDSSGFTLQRYLYKDFIVGWYLEYRKQLK